MYASNHKSSMDRVENAGNTLASKINAQFQLSAQVAAIDLRATANMNDASKIFYAGMNERIKDLVSAADRVQDHAEDALRFSADMASLLQKARRLESLVDRLDEYTSKQEAALSKK